MTNAYSCLISNRFTGLLIGGLISLMSFTSKADLVILQYHHVSDSTPVITSISPSAFEDHLRLLQQENMQIVSLPEAIRTLRAGRSLPDKAVAITFDDAYDSIYNEAFPRLKKRGWPFTVFVNTTAVDDQLPGNMSWAQLREMSKAGATIANHTVSHPSLVERPDSIPLKKWLKTEIDGAETRLKKEIGRSHKMLAYPYGEYSPDVLSWLKANDYTAFGQQSGAAYEGTQWQRVPRYPSAGVYADLDTLKQKLYTKAFQVVEESELDPVLESSRYPAFSFMAKTDDIHENQIQCFAAGQGKLNIRTKPVGDERVTVEVNAPGTFSGRRARYNCTAPSQSKPGWFYWHSQLWINSQESIR